MKYRIEIWKHHSVTDSYESDCAQECWKWIRHNGYGFADEEGLCYIAYYKDGKELSISEAVDLQDEWDEQFQKTQDTEGHEKPHKQTNFEWLKSLSEQDMAELLASQENITDLIRMTCLETHIDDCEEGCVKCWLKWLREERQEHNDKP